MIGPLPYIGGKNRLATKIISMLPEHKTYVEAFAGGAQVLFHKSPSNVEVLNDLDYDIVNFFRVCQWHYDELIRYLRYCLASRTLHELHVKSDPATLTDVQRAGRFYYLQKNSFGGLILKQKFHYGVIQPSNYNPERIPQVIEATHQRLARVQIESLPYEQVLEKYDRPTTLFYLDPPYWRRKLYKFNFADDDFRKLNERLAQLKGKFIFSIDDQPEIREIFKAFRMEPVNLAYTAKRDTKVRHNELLITNFDPVKNESTPLALKLSTFGGAIAWLIGKEVSSNRLAGIFGTTPENVRVIAHRARTASPFLNAPSGLHLGSPFSIELADGLGIRIGPDDVVRTPARNRDLAFIRNKLDEISRACASQYEFQAGVRRLRKILPLIGYPSDARRIALAARIHQQIAWFLVHSGRCASATEDAQSARDLWRVAHRESNSPEYAAGFVEASLIGSNALLLTRQPKEALAILDIAKDAADSIGAPLGSDHYRQRGVALLQLRDDQRAAQSFEKAAAMMEKLGEASIPEQILLTGARHRSLLDVNCDQAESVLAASQRGFGATSLEASMALNWATATLLSTDNKAVNQDAIARMLSAPEPAAEFGHQVTIRKLLVITLELDLDFRLRRRWVRRALYENAFSRR